MDCRAHVLAVLSHSGPDRQDPGLDMRWHLAAGRIHLSIARGQQVLQGLLLLLLRLVLMVAAMLCDCGCAM